MKSRKRYILSPQNERLHRLLFQIEAHGASVAFEHLPYLRELHRNEYTSWMQIKAALRHQGMPEAEIWMLVNVGHPRGCACWTCIGRLQAWVRATRAKYAPATL